MTLVADAAPSRSVRERLQGAPESSLRRRTRPGASRVTAKGRRSFAPGREGDNLFHQGENP